jgi:plastocyanin
MANSRRNVALSALSAAAALLLLPLGAAAADQAVSISGLAFHPATVTVNVGDTVTWTNNDGVSHTATADGGSFDTGTIGNGSSASETFNTAGTFAYHCTIHPTMQGSVVVQSASGGGGGGGGGGGVPGTDTAPLAPSSDGSATGLALLVGAAAGVLLGRRLVRRTSRYR